MAVAGVDCSYFLTFFGLWVSLADMQKVSNQESSHTWGIGTITLGKDNCSNPQLYGFVGKITARPSSLKTQRAGELLLKHENDELVVLIILYCFG